MSARKQDKMSLKAMMAAAAAAVLIKAEKKATRTELKLTSTMKWGIVCKDMDYNVDDEIALIPTAKGWDFEQDRAKLEGRKQDDSRYPALRPRTAKFPDFTFEGDESRSEHRMYMPTMLMLREFVLYRYTHPTDKKTEWIKGRYIVDASRPTVKKLTHIKWADGHNETSPATKGYFELREWKDKKDKETGEVTTGEERRQAAIDKIDFEDVRTLQSNKDKYARFIKFFGHVKKADVALLAEITHGDALHGLLKAIITTEGGNAFSKWKSNYKLVARRVSVKDVMSGKVSLDEAARQNHRMDRHEDKDRSEAVKVLLKIATDASKLRNIKEAHERFLAKAECVA